MIIEPNTCIIYHISCWLAGCWYNGESHPIPRHSSEALVERRTVVEPFDHRFQGQTWCK